MREVRQEGHEKCRLEHEAEGEPCEKCGHPVKCHRGKRQRSQHKGGKKPERYWIGIDGEGESDKDGQHQYTILCAAGGDFRRSIGNGKSPLTTRECLDFILSLPSESKIGGFCLGYDWTMMLRDMPDEHLWLLFHPEARQGENGPLPVKWGRYRLNLTGKGKMMVAKYERIQQQQLIGVRTHLIAQGFKRVSRTVWDVFGFFQGSFVSALEKWSIGTKESRARILVMKEQRSDFATIAFEKKRDYCLEECELLSELMTELDHAHDDAGLHLKNYYGAGSTAAILLDQLHIKDYISQPPVEMFRPVFAAYFGGRFENSVFGPVEGPIYSRDICSAYPYAMTKLPCLIHGAWRFVKNEKAARKAKLALVHYSFHRRSRKFWGPLPFRRENGNIVFPVLSGGGWSWGVEYWPAKAFTPELMFKGAWIYESPCSCHPFAELSEHYIQRLQWGKEARGIVLKLGMNSCYGKLAQRVGSKKFHSMVYAGLVTAHCRGQILEDMAQHKNERNILAIATDGIYSLENIESPNDKTLGSWEQKKYPSLFFIQPGVYFCPDTQENLTRSRGVPRSRLSNQQSELQAAFAQGLREFPIDGLVRFWGVKSSITRRDSKKKLGQFDYERSENYGQWRDHPHLLKYAAEPKRSLQGKDNRLLPWVLDTTTESAVYNVDLVSETTEVTREVETILSEQPEGNWE